MLQELSSGRDEALGVLAEPPPHTGGSGAPHPSLLDGALQAIVGLLPEDGSAPAMPFAVDSVEILRPLTHTRVRLRDQGCGSPLLGPPRG